MNNKLNVILVLSDQQRYDSLGAHGNPMRITPQLDRMASYGTDFDLAITPNPVCAPARSSLLTGKYPTKTGVYVNGPALGDQKTLAHVFKDNGYKTAYIGKWHLAPSDPVTSSHRGGFDTWLAANTLEFTSDEYRTIVYDENDVPVLLPGYRADGLTDAAINFIASQDRGPFFLVLSFIEPHHQNELDNYPAPDGYAEDYVNPWCPPDLASLDGNAHKNLPGYYGQIRKLDECVGRLRDALRSLELTNETVLIYTCDHGSHFRTRNEEYKRSAHDSSVRVPLVMFGGPFTAGGRRTELISTVDLPVTLAEIAGGSLPDVDGISFLPLIEGRDSYARDAVLIQISESQTARALRTPDWTYVVTAPDGDPKRDKDSHIYVEEGLYNNRADPYQLENLIHFDSFAEVTERLRDRLLSEIYSVEGERPEIRPAQHHASAERLPHTRAQRDRITPAQIGSHFG